MESITIIQYNTGQGMVEEKSIYKSGIVGENICIYSENKPISSVVVGLQVFKN